MYDRSKLSKIDWKYIIIDEAQRMKDRESVLARDLDRYRCQRRLLLTGTPLQVCKEKEICSSDECAISLVMNFAIIAPLKKIKRLSCGFIFNYLLCSVN